MKPVGEQLMFSLNRGGRGVLEGIDRYIKVKWSSRDRAGDGQKPLEDARVFRQASRSQTLRFRVPVARQFVMARMEDFVEHVVHGLHQIVSRPMI